MKSTNDIAHIVCVLDHAVSEIRSGDYIIRSGGEYHLVRRLSDAEYDAICQRSGALAAQSPQQKGRRLHLVD